MMTGIMFSLLYLTGTIVSVVHTVLYNGRCDEFS
jgi:hypothetical protein